MGLIKTSLVTAPTLEPLPLKDVKNHLRIEQGETADDDLLKRLRVAARKRIEGITNRKFINQTWNVYYDEWPDEDYIVLPYAPLSTGTSPSITYYDSDRSSTTLSTTAWYSDSADGQHPRLCLTYSDDWPTATLDKMNPIVVQAVFGYGSRSSNVPEEIRSAMLIMVSDMYEQRESFLTGTIVTNMDRFSHGTINALIASHRLWNL